MRWKVTAIVLVVVMVSGAYTLWRLRIQKPLAIAVVSLAQEATASLHPSRLRVAADIAKTDFLREHPDATEIEVVFSGYGEDEDGRSALDRVLEQYQVPIVIGDVTSSRSADLASWAKERQILHLSPIAVDHEFAVDNPWSFSLVATLDKEVSELVDLVLHTLGLSTVSVIYYQASGTANRLERFLHTARQEGLALGRVWEISDESFDFGAIIQTLRDKPQEQAVLLLMVRSHVEHFLQQARIAGLTNPVVVGSSVANAAFLQQLGSAAEGLFGVGHPILLESGDTDTQLSRFAEEYMQRVGATQPDHTGARIYDAVSLALQAVAIVGADADGVRRFLQGVDQEGLSAPLRFDDQGLASETGLVRVAMRGGELVFPGKGGDEVGLDD